MYSAAVRVYSAGRSSVFGERSSVFGEGAVRVYSADVFVCILAVGDHRVLFAMTKPNGFQRAWRGMQRSRLALLLAVSPANAFTSLEHAPLYL